MKIRFNLFLVSGFIVTLALLFCTLMFLSQMRTEALHQAKVGQEQAIRTFWQLLLSKGSDFRVVDGKMMADSYVVNGNFELPDKIKEIFGGTATIFLGDTRASTNVLKEDGTRAVGTRLTGPAYDAIFRENRAYRGEAPILGIPYLTAYDPIRDASGKTIGVLYVGIKKGEFLVGYARLKARIIVGTSLLEILLIALAWEMLRRRLQAETRLQEVARILSETTGDSYFPSLVENLSRLLQAEFAFIGELVGEHQDTIRVIAAFCQGKPVEPFSYQLAGTPCAEVVSGELRFYPDGVARRYPNNKLLDEMSAEGFLGMPLKLADGRVVGVLVVLDSKPLRTQHDIEPIFRLFAVRAAAELEHHRSDINRLEIADRIRLITDSVPVGIAYVDTKMRYLFANRRYDELFGLVGGGQLVGRTVGEVVGDTFFASREAKIRQALAGNEVSFTHTLTRSDGSSLMLQTDYIPHRGEGDAVIGYFIQHYDITCHMQLEASLQSQLAFLQTLIDTIPNPIFYKDRTGRYTGCNLAFEKHLELTREEVVGRTVYDLAPPDLADRYHAMDEKLFTNPGTQVYDASVIYADGSRHEVTFTKATFTDNDGTVAGLVGIMLDVTERKKAEDILAEKEEFLSNIFDSIQDGISILDEELRVIRVNPVMERWLSERGPLVGRKCHEAFNGRSEPCEPCPALETLRTGKPALKIYSKPLNNSVCWLEIYTYPVFDPQKSRITGVIENVRDVTERKRAEEWLAGEKSALEMIVKNAPLAEVLELLCKNFELQFPGALCSILLLEASGRCLRHIAAPSLPEDYARAIDGTRIGPQVGSCGTAAFTNQIVITADIATDPLWEKYRYLPLSYDLRSCWSMPIRSTKGTILGTFAVYRSAPHEPDTLEQQLVEQAAHLASIIIERNRNEAALLESEERFHQIFVQKDDAILLIRLDNLDIIDANPSAEQLFVCDRTELLSMRPYHLIAREDFDALIVAIPKSGPAEVFQMARAEGIRLDGVRITIAIRCKILLLHNEHVIHCSIRDITEKVQLEEDVRNTQAKLIHANKMTSIGMLASSVAHEINNPNNCISVNAAMMADVWKDAEPLLKAIREEQGEFMLRGIPFSKMQEFAPRLLDGIREGSRRITAIVQNMRDYVREDKSGCHGSIDINQLLQNAIAILWHHIHIHTDNFTTAPGEGLQPARGNGQQVEQVLINLITNALQSLPDKKAGVYVTTSMENGESIIIKVRDEGMGMNEATLARLTEPFFTTRTDDGGTGLGLYISASIIKEHGGTLEFQSEPGIGTTAICRLPLA